MILTQKQLDLTNKTLEENGDSTWFNHEIMDSGYVSHLVDSMWIVNTTQLYMEDPQLD
jgi:hypothetical protein